MNARLVAVSALAVCAAACAPEPFPDEVAATATTAAQAPATPADTSTPAFWTIHGSGSIDESASVRKVILGKEGQLFIRFKDSLVANGDTVTAQAKLTSPTGRQLQMILQRHCNPENGEDYERTTQNVTVTPYTMEVTHTFSAGYECLRLTVFAPDKLPMDFEISDVVYTRMSPTP